MPRVGIKCMLSFLLSMSFPTHPTHQQTGLQQGRPLGLTQKRHLSALGHYKNVRRPKTSGTSHSLGGVGHFRTRCGSDVDDGTRVVAVIAVVHSRGGSSGGGNNGIAGGSGGGRYSNDGGRGGGGRGWWGGACGVMIINHIDSAFHRALYGFTASSTTNV